jgi:hypothetical protein
MTQHVQIDTLDNVVGFIESDDLPEIPGIRYEVQDPPVLQYPVPPHRNNSLKRIDGQNVWIDNRTYEERCEDVRAERDKRYALSDRVIMQCFRLQQTMPTPWADYAQALADVPQQSGFPDDVTWPTPPN